MFANPSSDMVEVLTTIWKRAFRQNSIRPDDNFLSIGGDAEKAAAIAAEISSLGGHEISPSLVLQASTIASLADILAKTELPPAASILPLNDSGQGPPIFIAPGIGDTVTNLLRLANNLQSCCAIYGMQAAGVDGVQEPLHRIEEMAQYHLEAMRKVQPHGPYFLIGYSLGGLVVLEIARSLSQAGEEIGFLAMLDSYPDRRYFAFGHRIRWEWSQKNRRAVDLSKRVKRFQTLLASRLSRKLHKHPQEFSSLNHAMSRVKSAQYEALRSYRPRYYNGRVNFVKAEIASYFPADPTPIWRRLVGELEVEVIPGSHLDMLNAQVEKLATVVRCLLPEILIDRPALRRIS
jgi:thioesterase domain-containing protein